MPNRSIFRNLEIAPVVEDPMEFQTVRSSATGRNGPKFRARDWVEVKTPREIAETLDADGTTDGLPFMPEMLEFCGRRFQVQRLAEKTCIEFPGGTYKIREFRNNDVVLLGGLRCPGTRHDGCQRLCMIFWKTAWLRKVELDQPPACVAPHEYEELGARLKTMSGPARYCCQATELARATIPLTRKRILLKCYYDVRSGSRGFFEMVWLILAPLWRKTTSRIPRHRLLGTLTRTPVGNLNLQPSELAVIKSESEIAQTLDARGRNRGLVCDLGMSQYSGGTYKVQSRLERMISESSGEMLRVESTVILEGLNCLCWRVLGGCPRQDFMYWREVWLERGANKPDETPP
jgi:hypothetical protein